MSNAIAVFRNKAVAFIWFICLLLAAFIIVFFINAKPLPLDVPQWAVVLSLFLLSAFCEYIDSSLGMGYGTTLTPLLLTAGVLRQELVPAILLSEFLTGFFASIAHHRVGNINLKENKPLRLALPLLALPSVIGVFVAVFIGSRLKEQGQYYANLYIGSMILAIGVYLILLNRYGKSTTGKVRKPVLVFLGVVAAFNKGISGGGYGPLMTGGQLASGIKGKEAVVITSLCECFTCMIGLVVFFILGGSLNLLYAIPLCFGAMTTVIPAAKTIRILPEKLLRNTIGWATLLMGLVMLWKFMH